MNLRLFFYWFWLVFITWFVTLGVVWALLAGVFFAQGHFASGLVTGGSAIGCGILCRLASESRRQLPPLQ